MLYYLDLWEYAWENFVNLLFLNFLIFLFSSFIIYFLFINFPFGFFLFLIET